LITDKHDFSHLFTVNFGGGFFGYACRICNWL
jgi:hypothetical protein